MPEKDDKKKTPDSTQRIQRFIYTEEDLKQIQDSNGIKVENKLSYFRKKLTETSKKLNK
jgi:hypothetical protein